MKAVRNIEEMSNWDILTYLRTERNWMVQTHYLRQQIDCEFTDAEWVDFTNFACDSFDYVKKEIMDTIVELWLDENDEDSDNWDDNE